MDVVSTINFFFFKFNKVIDVKWINLIFLNRQNDISEVFDTNFCVEHNHYGLIQIRELKPGGRDLPVTDKNKEEYVK